MIEILIYLIIYENDNHIKALNMLRLNSWRSVNVSFVSWRSVNVSFVIVN